MLFTNSSLELPKKNIYYDCVLKKHFNKELVMTVKDEDF